MTGRPEFAHWCNRVCRQMRFRPDQAAVYQELMDHLRDSAEELERQGLESRQAVLRAVEQMGDAEELGRQLDHIHSPWLGWLWVCSRWALGIALALALFSLFPLKEKLGWIYSPWPEQRFYADRIQRVAAFQPDCRAEYGGYRFSIPEGAVDCFTGPIQDGMGQEELSQSYQLELVLRSWNPRFYLKGPYLSAYLHLEDSLGNRYVTIDSPAFRTDRPSLRLAQERQVFGVREQKWVIWFDYGQSQVLGELEWMELVYQREGQGFRLRIPLEKGWLDEGG